MAATGLRLLPKEEGTVATVGTVAPVARTMPARPDGWPDAVAFREAVQNPNACFLEPRLQSATFALDRRGLPLAYTGRFAVVFRAILGDGSAWAVRCYTSAEKGQQGLRAERYQRLGAALQQAGVAGLFAPFHYEDSGIRVAGKSYPVLAMPWVAGDSLGRFFEKNLTNPGALLTLARALGEAQKRLESAGIAHGDWQHDNIFVGDGGRRVTFVDYDGVYAHELWDLPPTERGHPNYQHPARTEADYGPLLDRFPCLLMQTALVALAVEPSLWDSYSDGESLVFHRADLEGPEDSVTFATVRLVSHAAPELGALLRSLDEACRSNVPPSPVDPAVLGRVAAWLGVAVETPLLDATAAPQVLPGRRVTVAPLLEHEIEETAEETAAKRRSFLETVAVSSEALRWFNSIRVGLQKQQTLEQIHLWVTRLFALALFCFINFWPFQEPDPLYRGVGSFFFGPAFTAILYFLWPRNLEGIAVEEAKERNDAQLEINQAQLTEVSQRLHAINRNPANLSAIAFVAAALQTARLTDAHVGAEAGLTDADVQRLHVAGITRLSDLPADRSVPLDAARRQTLYEIKAELMDAARRAYDDLSKHRRTIQQDRDRLEAERQGLIDADYELRRRLALMGSGSFGRFLFRVLGG